MVGADGFAPRPDPYFPRTLAVLAFAEVPCHVTMLQRRLVMPSNLLKRKNNWYVRVAIPRPLWSTLGRREIQRTTGTSDLKIAERRKHAIIADIKDEIDTLVVNDPTSEQWLRRQAVGLRRAVARGDIDEQLASDIMFDLLDKNRARDDVKVHSMRLASDQQYLPVGDLIDTYLDEKKPNVVRSTLAKKKAELAALSKFLGEGREVSEVDRRVTGEYLQHMTATGRSLPVQRVALSILIAFWNWCIRRGHYEKVNPWSGLGVDLQGPRKRPGNYRRPWTDGELALIEGIDPTDVMYPILKIAMYTGMRLNEVAHLKLDDVNLEAPMLVVRDGKTVSSIRQVPIHPDLLGLVQHWYLQSDDGYLIAGLEAGGQDQKRGWAVGKRIGRWIRANVTEDKAVVFHTLRNTFIHRCELAGIPESTTKLLVGHARQSLTYGLYSPGVDFERLKEAVGRVVIDFTPGGTG